MTTCKQFLRLRSVVCNYAAVLVEACKVMLSRIEELESRITELTA